MMNILCIDTSADKIALAMQISGNEPKYFIGSDDKKKHNAVLLGYIEKLLTENGADIKDIDVFGVVSGPGSFTGIRVGVATVNAFAMANDKKIVEITSLEQLSNGNNMIMLDCKHNNFYCGIFVKNDAEYLALTKYEIETYNIEKALLEGVYPDLMLKKCMEKAEKGLFVPQAKPFYLKASSAERENTDL